MGHVVGHMSLLAIQCPRMTDLYWILVEMRSCSRFRSFSIEKQMALEEMVCSREGLFVGQVYRLRRACFAV